MEELTPFLKFKNPNISKSTGKIPIKNKILRGGIILFDFFIDWNDTIHDFFHFQPPLLNRFRELTLITRFYIPFY